MRTKALILAIAFMGSLALTNVAMACHSNYFDSMFVKLQNMRKGNEFTTEQVTALWDLTGKFKDVQKLYNRQGKPSRALDPHVDDFVAAAAGVLDSDQFQKITGKKKTEAQELRYEVNQLKKELAAIKAMLRDLKASMKK